MKKFASVGILAAASALAIAAPVTAKPTHPSHPSHPAHPVKSHKCVAHKVAYTASGTFVSWAATKNANGTYTGTITVHVTKANHHATGAKGNAVTYTLADTKVVFGKTANPPAAGDRVKLIGKITEVAKKCSDHSDAGTITLRKVDIRTPQGQK